MREQPGSHRLAGPAAYSAVGDWSPVAFRCHDLEAFAGSDLGERGSHVSVVASSFHSHRCHQAVPRPGPEIDTHSTCFHTRRTPGGGEPSGSQLSVRRQRGTPSSHSLCACVPGTGCRLTLPHIRSHRVFELRGLAWQHGRSPTQQLHACKAPLGGCEKPQG